MTLPCRSKRTHAECIRSRPRPSGVRLGSVSTISGSSVAKDKIKTKTAIYHPPKKGMPYLVVTVSSDGVTVTAVGSKDEARILASKKTMEVQVQDATVDKH